jgi:hypothetical protein
VETGNGYLVSAPEAVRLTSGHDGYNAPARHRCHGCQWLW